jgi:hypothetical protein
LRSPTTLTIEPNVEPVDSAESHRAMLNLIPFKEDEYSLALGLTIAIQTMDPQGLSQIKDLYHERVTRRSPLFKAIYGDMPEPYDGCSEDYASHFASACATYLTVKDRVDFAAEAEMASAVINIRGLEKRGPIHYIRTAMHGLLGKGESLKTIRGVRMAMRTLVFRDMGDNPINA